MPKYLPTFRNARFTSTVIATTLGFTVGLLFFGHVVNAQTASLQEEKEISFSKAEVLRSSIQPPTSTEIIGSFNEVTYIRHRGRFTGQTEVGHFEVPYEITVPLKTAAGNGIFVFEPPHFLGGAVGRDFFLGPQFLFERGLSHASVGYSNVGMRILDRNPGFTPVIRDQPIPPFVTADQQNEVTDTSILRQFVLALKQDNSFFPGQVERVYAVGFSDSGDTLRSLYEHSGIACSISHTPAQQVPRRSSLNRQNPIMVIDTDGNFEAGSFSNFDLPQSRYYAVAGGPHTLVSGTTPINWLPFVRSLFVAGDLWVRSGTLPPASGELSVNNELQ